MIYGEEKALEVEAGIWLEIEEEMADLHRLHAAAMLESPTMTPSAWFTQLMRIMADVAGAVEGKGNVRSYEAELVSLAGFAIAALTDLRLRKLELERLDEIDAEIEDEVLLADSQSRYLSFLMGEREEAA